MLPRCSTRADLLTRWPALEVAVKRDRLRRSLRIAPGPISARVRADTAPAQRAAGAMWRREPSAWSASPEVQATIANRLGWLDVARPDGRLARSPQVVCRRRQARRLHRRRAARHGRFEPGARSAASHRRHGAGLAAVPDARLDGSRRHPRGRDASASDAVPAGEQVGHDDRTEHARGAFPRARWRHAGIARWADHFVAITDEGTELARRARAESFRDTFINPSDIGGRYSALSFFGLVPAALMGQDIAALTGWGLAMLSAAAEPVVDANPAVTLGLLLGAAAREGRDKLTLLLPPELEPFGLWVEQLVAESTGKNGVGVVPIAGEVPGAPAGTATTACSSKSAAPAPRAGAATSTGSKPPATRRRRSTGPSRPRSARSSFAGKSRRPSRARCSRSTRSTSPTSSRRRTRPRRCWARTSRTARCRERRPT